MGATRKQTAEELRRQSLVARGDTIALASIGQRTPDFKELYSKAYDDFANGEGEILNVYLDNCGNPTIGCGHLLFSTECAKKALHSKEAQKEMAVQREAFLKNFSGIEKTQRALQFDILVVACQQGKLGPGPEKYKYVVPCYAEIDTRGTLNKNTATMALQPITPRQSREIYKKDFQYFYDVCNRKIPYLKELPEDVQLAIVHCAFAGQSYALDGCRDRKTFPLVLEKVRNVRSNCSAGERDTINKAIAICNKNIGCNIPKAFPGCGATYTTLPNNRGR